MAQNDRRSLNEIKRETQQARTALLETVEELRTSVGDRVNPASIKAELGGYVRSRARELFDDASRAARQNPLQAAAVVGTLAYPALRLVRSVPLPVWLVGAGLYLAKSDAVATGAISLQERVTEAGSRIANGARDAFDTASEQLNQAGERVGSAAASGSDTVSSAAGSAAASLRQASEKIGDTGAQLSASVSEKVSGVAQQAVSLGQDAVQSAKTSLSKAADATTEAASAAGDRAASTFYRTLEENPLLLAGVGLFVGGVIAGALPRTDVEGVLMGGASRAAKRRAQAATDRGIDALSEAAREGARRAAQQADEEGLDQEGLKDAVRDVGQRVRRVAEAAVTTAFEPREVNEQFGVEGGRQNG